MYNNFYQGIKGSAINSRMGACVKIENNVFETVKSPIVAEGSTIGKYQLVGNAFSGITGTTPPTSSTCTLTLPYSYTPDATGSVKTEVTTKAGIGKI